MADTDKQAEALRARVLEDLRASIDGVAAELESPIERLLYWALLARSSEMGPPNVQYLRPLGISSWFAVHGDLDEVTVFPQHEVEVGASHYRLDFYVQAKSKAPTVTGETQEIVVKAAVECDGHDFHERTKEQAKRDRRRDRELQAAGFIVLRFTGSEINRDPLAVAKEIVTTVEARAQSLFSAAYDAWDAARKAKE